MPESFKNKIISAASKLEYPGIFECYDSPFISLDFYIVAVGSLSGPGTREQVLATVDALLASVLEVRRRSSPAIASDLYVMLEAPVGSLSSPAWKELAAEIERDDRLARKHVWLPDVNSSNFHEFVRSTFLARPWDSPAGTVDALKLMADDLAMPDGWQDVLLDAELEGSELIEELIRLEKDSVL